MTGVHLFDETVEGARVAVHQPHDEAAGTDRLRGLDQQPGPHGLGELLPLLAVPGVDDLDVGSGMGQHHVVAGDAVEDHDVGGGKQVAAAQGQQPGVTRA